MAKHLKYKWYYIHTIHGVPAQYIEGEQITYANGTRGGAGIKTVALSLRQIKRERQLSIAWRHKQGFYTDSLAYGYVRILVDFKVKVQ